MSIWWDKYKFLVILVVFACFTYLLSDNQTANEQGKVLDDETFAEMIASSHPRDHTIRPQVVTQSMNPDYHKMLVHYEKITGSGVVLNTSFPF